MTGWAKRRFWTEVTVAEEPEGFAVLLDTRPLRTPGRAPLVLPTRALAEAVAAEWVEQDTVIRPETMPATRAVNTAIDRVAPDPVPLRDHLAGYGETDLLCHRATAPEALVARQTAGWDPMLGWASDRFGARLRLAEGVMPVLQPAAALAALRAALDAYGPFELTALSELVTLSGSLVLGLAVAHAVRPAPEVWDLATMDESWQREQWGEDAEAAAMLANRRQAFLLAANLMQRARR
jgi:chaperone required for assembly of F1-ATPase